MHRSCEADHDGRDVMMGRVIDDSQETLVHGHLLKKGFATYEISTVYANVITKWNGYNSDIHVPGVYVARPKQHVVKRKAKVIVPPVLEESYDSLLREKRRYFHLVSVHFSVGQSFARRIESYIGT